MGKRSSLEGCKLICVHFVFDVKHDGRHKGRLTDHGHLPDVPLSSVYSRAVSLRGIRLVLFVAEINQLHSWGTSVMNACLEAFSKEKVYIKSGREFVPLEGHILIINKVLCALRTSCLRWHERLSDYQRDIECEPCNTKPDVWLKDCRESL